MDQLLRSLKKGRALLELASARHWLLLSLALFLSGLALKLAYNVLFDVDDKSWIQALDNETLLLVSQLRNNVLTASMVDITALGSATLVTLIGVVFFTAFWLMRDAFGIVQLVLAAAGAGVWSKLFKHFAERPRPTIVEQLVEVTGHSFPSGHTLASAALYITFATMAGRHVKGWRVAMAFQVLAGFVIACVAFSRVYLGVHYPSDVLSGALLGAAWAYFVAGALGFASARAAARKATKSVTQ